MYRSVAFMEACPSRNWISSISPPAICKRRAQLRRKIVRSQLFDPGTLCAFLHGVPDHILRQACAPQCAVLPNSTKHSTLADASRRAPPVDCALHPQWHRHRAHVVGFVHRGPTENPLVIG
jgi:hypothetical protein